MKCLVIEDDVSTSQYICKGFNQAGHMAQACDNGVDGLHQAANEVWDIIILDRMLPGNIDGLSILAKLRDLGKTTPVLILSALNSIDERVKGLRAGSDDYVSKPFAFSELLARAEVLLRRNQTSYDLNPVQLADLVVDSRALRVTRAGQTINLQPREFRLLDYLMRHAGQVVTRTMLLEGVWDCHFDPQTNVIDVQISRLRTKIDKGFSPALIHTVRGHGYMLGITVGAV